MTRSLSALLVSTLLLLPACAPDTPSPTEREPAPQTGHTELRDAMQAPQDRARAAESSLQDAAQAQRRQLDEAGG